jgi:hypothetical protein
VLLGVTDTVSVPVAVGLAVLPLAWRVFRERPAGPTADGAARPESGTPTTATRPAPRARGSRAGANV